MQHGSAFSHLFQYGHGLAHFNSGGGVIGSDGFCPRRCPERVRVYRSAFGLRDRPQRIELARHFAVVDECARGVQFFLIFHFSHLPCRHLNERIGACRIVLLSVWVCERVHASAFRVINISRRFVYLRSTEVGDEIHACT